jgi:hypothetical protein
MAVPDVLKIEAAPWTPSPELFQFVIWVANGDEPEPFSVVISATQAITAGFGGDGPPIEWVRERFLQHASMRLRNDVPVLQQLKAWESPIVLGAAP